MIKLQSPQISNIEEQKDDNSTPLTITDSTAPEVEENIKSKEEEHLSEEELLGYNSNYTLNKDNEFILKRKTSTCIPHLGVNSGINNLFFSKNEQKINDRKMSYAPSSNIFFGRERLNSTPVTTYFEGMDFYLRGLNPEKNEYHKTNNYIEKEQYFRTNNIYLRKNIHKNSANNLCFDKLKINDFKRSNSNIENLNDNNNQNIISQSFKAQNYNNGIYGKFDMPIYYIPYYGIDCKLLYLILL